MDKKIAEEPKKEFTLSDFDTAYKELCEKMGYRISVAPSWVPTNHGSYELVLRANIEKIPETVDKNK